MKKALNLVIIYFITLFSGVFLGTILYSFYINVLNFVAGSEIQFFAKNEITDAFFYVSFFVLFIVCFLISCYRIRHPGGIAQIVAFICLAILTWCVFIPCVYNVSEKHFKVYEYSEPEEFSKGYFRQAGNKIYYFTKDFRKNSKGKMEAPAIIIDLDNENAVSIANVVDSPDFDLRKETEPYSEILIKNTFQENDFSFSMDFRNIILNYRDNMNNGFLGFLGFLSFGLAICSVFALTNVFHWNLLNTMLITSLSFLVLFVNSNPVFFSNISKGMKLKFLSKLGNEPFIILVNFLLSLLSILTGIVLFFIRRNREKNI